MIPTPVWWLNLHPETCHPADTWDTMLLQATLDGRLWPTGLTFAHLRSARLAPGGGGAVVFLNGGHHAGDLEAVNDRLADLDWAVVLLTSDEGSLFPVDGLVLPDRSRLWAMTPRPDRTYPDGTRFIGEGWPAGTDLLLGGPGPERTVDLYFAGQVNHERRQTMWDQIGVHPHRLTVAATRSAGFARGVPRHEYLEALRTARIVAAPGGPRTPDSFRAYEALEAGCVPILDRTTSNGYPSDGYWAMVAPGYPGPVIDDWADLWPTVDRTLGDWPAIAAECDAWWQQHKRWVAVTLAADVAEVSG